MKYAIIKHRIFEIIETPTESNKASKIFDVTSITLILLNLGIVIAETFALPDAVQGILQYIEIISIAFFTMEYILRLVTSDLKYPELSKFKSRVRYMFSFLAIIDLLSILPFYIPMLIPVDLRVLRTLRIFRIFRILKINRYTNALTTIGQVFKNKASQLISSCCVVFVLMLIAAILMFNIENAAQPDTFKNAFDAIWWAVATLTTVGYGDIYPVTDAGKILSSIIAILGIGFVAVPTGIITAGFQEELSKNDTEEKEKKYCPYCGEKLE